MKHYPTISIVIPSFNQGHYIEQTLDSIKQQNYPKPEIIIVDGGSTDSTLEILERRSAELAWWCSEPDRGQTHAINKGLERMQGDVWLYLNSDDLLAPKCLQSVAEAWNSETHWIWGDALIFDSVGEHGIISPGPTTREIEFLTPWQRKERYVLPCSCSCFLSRAIFQQCGKFDESLHYGMDKEYYMRVLLKHRLKPTRLKKVLAKWRHHPASKTMQEGIAYGFLNDQISISESYASLLPPDQQSELSAQLGPQKRELAYRIYRFARSKADLKNSGKALANLTQKHPIEIRNRRWWIAISQLIVDAIAPLSIRTRIRTASSNMVSALLAFCIRTARKIRAPRKTRLLVPPASAGSIGDEAMVTAWIEQTLGDTVGIITGSFAIENDLAPDAKHLSVDRLLGSSRLRSELLLGYLLLTYSSIEFVGADVLDGHYSVHRSLRRLSLISFSGRCGADTRILGCSLNTNPHALVRDQWATLPKSVRICARDPNSFDRIEQIVNRNISNTADIAFLLKPASDLSLQAANIKSWIKTQKTKKRLVVGLNLNPALLPGMSDSFTLSLVHTIASGLASDCPVSILLIPHDSRKSADDPRLLCLAEEELMLNNIPAEKTSPHLSAAEIKHLAGELDVVITSRMHLAIAALGQGTPVVAFEYQDKFSGLYELFKLNDCVLKPTVTDGGIRVDAVPDLLQHKLPSIRLKIANSLPDILQLATLNLRCSGEPC